MARIRFIHDFVSDAATLTASSTAAALVAANMQRSKKAAVWRSMGTTATVTARWSAAVEVDSFALGWSNLTPGATITIRLFALADDADPVRVVGAATDADIGAGVAQAQAWFSKISIEKAEIEFSDESNAEGFIEISRLALGRYYEMAYNPRYGSMLGFVDRSKSSRAESGDVRIDWQGAYRTLNIDFGFIRATDAEFLSRLAVRRRSLPMFVSVFPSLPGLKGAAYAFFAVLSGGTQSLSYLAPNAWSGSVTLEEIG